MAAVVGNLCHDMSTDVVGCCDVNTHPPTMAAGFRAVVSAAVLSRLLAKGDKGME